MPSCTCLAIGGGGAAVPAAQTVMALQYRILGVLRWQHSSVVVARVRQGRGRRGLEQRLPPRWHIPVGPRFLQGLLAVMQVLLFASLDLAF